jgi:hypothetical protein
MVSVNMIPEYVTRGSRRPAVALFLVRKQCGILFFLFLTLFLLVQMALCLALSLQLYTNSRGSGFREGKNRLVRRY